MIQQVPRNTISQPFNVGTAALYICGKLGARRWGSLMIDGFAPKKLCGHEKHFAIIFQREFLARFGANCLEPSNGSNLWRDRPPMKKISDTLLAV
jgi:hypothetical protein